MYYKNAAAVVVNYDCTKEDTFLSIESWVKEIDNNESQHILLAIAGNKCDMNHDREVPYEHG